MAALVAAHSDCQNCFAVAVSGLTNSDSLRFDTRLFAGMAASFGFAVPVALDTGPAVVAGPAMAFAAQILCLLSMDFAQRHLPLFACLYLD